MTNEQIAAIESKLKDGYVVFGETTSILNGLKAVMLVKGSRTVVINSLGYDEHTNGKTWRLV